MMRLLLDFSWSGRLKLIQKVILMAKMLLHFLDPEHRVNVSHLAQESGVIHQTLYQSGFKRSHSSIGEALIPNRELADDPSDMTVKVLRI